MIPDYSERKVTSDELPGIFKSNFYRSLFIWEYLDYGEDGNDAFYIDFIDNNINSPKYNLQEDALELAIGMHHFKETYTDVVSNIIYSRKGVWMKLLCLDWLHNFFDELPATVYVELNERLAKNRSEILKYQSLKNLLLVDSDNASRRLLKLLYKTSNSWLFYRFTNSENTVIFFDKETLRNLMDHVIAHEDLSPATKSDLVKKLTTMIG